jgi:hypothetical protein
MMFKVTHFDPQLKRTKALVTACNVSDCIKQVEAVLGDHAGLSVVRLQVRPVLHVVPTAVHAERRRHDVVQEVRHA